MQTNTFWLNFGGLCVSVTLKIRSRSPKPIQFFIMSKCYSHANLVKIRQLVYEIWCTQTLFGLILVDYEKNRSRSPKPNQLFIISQCYIHANLVKIHSSVHEISCKLESVTLKLTPTPTGSAQKTICPPPLRRGT